MNTFVSHQIKIITTSILFYLFDQTENPDEVSKYIKTNFLVLYYFYGSVLSFYFELSIMYIVNSRAQLIDILCDTISNNIKFMMEILFTILFLKMIHISIIDSFIYETYYLTDICFIKFANIFSLIKDVNTNSYYYFIQNVIIRLTIYLSMMFNVNRLFFTSTNM